MPGPLLTGFNIGAIAVVKDPASVAIACCPTGRAGYTHDSRVGNGLPPRASARDRGLHSRRTLCTGGEVLIYVGACAVV